jgi:flagellin-like protein
MRGIEPIIAVVILVAVTLVIAIGVIGWLMGWWGTLGAVESLQLMGDSKLYDDGTVELHVVNKGSAAAVVYKVEIVGLGSTSTINGTTTGFTLTPGADTTITAKIDVSGIVPGTSYNIKIYTKAGNTYQITLVAETS